MASRERLFVPKATAISVLCLLFLFFPDAPSGPWRYTFPDPFFNRTISAAVTYTKNHLLVQVTIASALPVDTYVIGGALPSEDILLYAESKDTLLPFTIENWEIRESGRTHIVFAECALLIPGEYRLLLRFEWFCGAWHHYAKDTRPYTPLLIRSPFFSVHQVQSASRLRQCSPSDNLAGGWYKKAPLTPFLPPDQHGNFFLPSSCNLRTFSQRGIELCLSRFPVLHWFGDSNSRRAVKQLTSSWCAHNRTSAFCVCEDYHEEMPSDFWANRTIGTSKVHFWFLRGLVYSEWQRLDSFAGAAFDKKPLLVVLSLVNWDASHSNFTVFSERLQRFVAHVKAVYGQFPTFVYRSAQFVCCAATVNTTRAYTHGKWALFEYHTRQLFAKELGALIWDVSALAAARPMEWTAARLKQCASNHADSDTVRLENQLLANLLCPRP